MPRMEQLVSSNTLAVGTMYFVVMGALLVGLLALWFIVRKKQNQ